MSIIITDLIFFSALRNHRAALFKSFSKPSNPFKKLSPNAITPSYAKDGDAGLDISAITYTINKEHSFIEYHTCLLYTSDAADE